ncbi:MAG: nucleotide exchange factor GrpE [Cardiobacteriaceae bacterium]|nr:nucleotide exchange factor GrpE [Cardiobacteriaceae bacterium]
MEHEAENKEAMVEQSALEESVVEASEMQSALGDDELFKALHEEIAALKTAVLRERADGENLRKRLERDAQNAARFANEQLVKSLIPVLDSLTLGLEAAQKQASDEQSALGEFVKGSEMTLKMLLETLAKHGVEEINPVGEKLNPELHQALSVIPNPEVEANTILFVPQKGYVLHGRVLRAAQVIVAG